MSEQLQLDGIIPPPDHVVRRYQELRAQFPELQPTGT